MTGSNACGPYRAHVTIPRATIELTDETAPVAVPSSGGLAGDDPIRGTASLAFQASDLGGGVYRSILEVDGDEVARRQVDGTDLSCADVEPANGDAYEFSAPQPCPLDTSGEVTLDTTALHDGEHTIRISVEDAAGNVDVVRDGAIVTHNAPIALAVPALAGTARVGATLTATTGQWDGSPSAYGYRWLRCSAAGDDCAGIPGADDATYTATAADAYRRLVVEVTAENDNGADQARSAVSSLIADAAGHTTPPIDTNGQDGGIRDLRNPLGDVAGHVGNGAGATTKARLTAGFKLADGRAMARITLRREQGAVVTGRLTTDDGTPIADARVGVASRIAGRSWLARGTVRTGSDGRFAYRLPAGPSRSVKLTYFAFSDSGRYVASNVIKQEVLATVSIRANARRVTGDRVVRLSGRVAGSTIPRGGVLVTLQGYQAGWGWRTFRTVRTTARGAWTTRYRFRLSHGRFGFRAVVPAQGGFPYLTNHSGGVFVTVA
jgi:hypothetical protein